MIYLCNKDQQDASCWSLSRKFHEGTEVGNKGVPSLTTLTLKEVDGQYHAPGHFTPKKETHGTGGLVGHRINLNGCRNLALLGFEPLTIQHIACCYPGYLIIRVIK